MHSAVKTTELGPKWTDLILRLVETLSWYAHVILIQQVVLLKFNRKNSIRFFKFMCMRTFGGALLSEPPCTCCNGKRRQSQNRCNLRCRRRSKLLLSLQFNHNGIAPNGSHSFQMLTDLWWSYVVCSSVRVANAFYLQCKENAILAYADTSEHVDQ